MAITTVSNDYLAQFNISVGVSAVIKAGGFSYLQRLNYNAMLEPLKENFLSLNDWASQIQLYSATNTAILMPAYTAIKTLIPLNTEITLDIITIEALGLVGNLLATIPGFNTLFNMSNNQLNNSSTVQANAASI